VTTNADDNRRRRILLIALAAVLLIAAWRLVSPMLGFRGDDAVILPAPTQRPTAGAGHLGVRPGDRVAVLRMADLDGALREPARGRDPWSFVDPPQSPLPPQTKSQASTAEEVLPKGKEEQPLPHPPEFDLQYLGRFGPPDKQIAVFTRGREIFNKQEGDVIDNQFIVTHIGDEAVEIRFVGFPEVPAKRVGVTRRR
jgi:hypothetical protein